MVYRFDRQYLPQHNPVYSRSYLKIRTFLCTMGNHWDGYLPQTCIRNLNISSWAWKHLLISGSFLSYSDKPEKLVDIRYWSLTRYFFRLSGDGWGCEARVGVRKTVTVMKDRNRTAINETSRATE
jgi:hypothetical protein